MHFDATHRATEAVARQSYGRLLALLAARTRDIAAAEDALAEALAAALRHWPESGVPDNPCAWLMTAASNVLRNAARHDRVTQALAIEIQALSPTPGAEDRSIPDERLELLFVCAHPAIDERIRTPLMLQTVLGLDAGRIGAAFLVSGSAMAQRLVRAKSKIRDAGLRFGVPEAREMQERLEDVLEAVYAAYGLCWDTVPGADDGNADLVSEAVYLARLLVQLLPAEPEPKGLLALMLYCEARRPARRNAKGAFVPLVAQDPRRWHKELIVQAEGLLIEASRAARFGRFQCEAAIQSVHVQRPLGVRVPEGTLVTLYRMLVSRAPSVGAVLAYAAALLDSGDVDAALATLDDLSSDAMANHQPYWVVRSRVFAAVGDPAEADRALQKALELTGDGAVRQFLIESSFSAGPSGTS